MAKIIPTNGSTLIKNVGSKSLPDNPSKSGFSAAEIKNALNRPIELLFSWTSALDEKLENYVDGSTVVEKAKKDKDGNQIDTTYAKLAGNNSMSGNNSFSGTSSFSGALTFTADLNFNGTSSKLKGQKDFYDQSYFHGNSTFLSATIIQAYLTTYNVLPATDNTYDLGSSSKVYKKIYTNGISDGTYSLALPASNGTVITAELVASIYETKTDAAAKVDRSNLVTIIKEATQSLNGLMSATDKARLDALYAMLDESEENSVVDSINEILSIFEDYPEGADLVTVLAGKVGFSDVINNVASDEINKPLAAYQGKVLKGLIDAINATIADYLVSVASIAPVYSSSETYSKGDMVVYGITLYRALQDISTAEAWTAAHWESVNVVDLISEKITRGASERDATLWAGKSDLAILAENANNLIATKGLTVNDDPMSYGIVGGASKSSVGDGNASLNKLVCVDVVRNQLAYKLKSAYYYNEDGARTFDSDGTETSMTISSSNSQSQRGRLLSNSGKEVTFVSGHRYLLCIDVKLTKDIQDFGYLPIKAVVGGSEKTVQYINVGSLTANVYKRFMYLPTVDFSGSGLLSVTKSEYFTSEYFGETISYRNLKIVDLTQSYGNNDVVNAIIGTGTTAEKVNRLLSFDPGLLAIISSVNRDAGTLVPSKTAKLLPVGVNQWDEEWEVGGINYDTGVNTTSSDRIRAKNLNRCLPNTQYYLKGTNLNFYWYDANGGFISSIQSVGSNILTSPADARYFKLTQTSTTIYNHDICINVSDANINGKYYPSKRTPVTLPNYEGHGLLKVVDGKVVADGTELYPDGNSKKRYGTYTFTGNENWNYYESGTRWILNIQVSASMIPPGSDAGVLDYKTDANVSVGKTSSTYNANGWFVYGNMSGGNYYLTIQIRDATNLPSSVNPKTIFTAGKKLIYKLKTEEDITTPVFQSTFPVEQGGTLQFLDENDSPIAGLQGSEIFYQKNLKAFTEAMGEAVGWDPERIRRLGNLSFTPEYVNITLDPSPTGAYARAQVYNATFTIVISAALTGTANGSITFQDSEVDLSNFQTEPAEAIYDMDGKKVSEAPTTADCNIASFVGRSKSGIVLWSLLHSGVNKVKIHIEEAVPLDSEGNGKIDCRASLIL